MGVCSRRLPVVLLTLIPVAVFVVSFGWLTYDHILRTKLSDALLSAVKAKSAGRVRELLDRGADPNVRDRREASPGGLWGLLAILSQHGSDAETCQGKTVLMLAASNEEPSCVRLLLAHNAAVDARDQDGE